MSTLDSLSPRTPQTLPVLPICLSTSLVAPFFDVFVGSFSVWLHRYVNQPQPELHGSSVTLQATQDRIQHMHREADLIWPPQLAELMKVSTLCLYTTSLNTQPASGLLRKFLLLLHAITCTFWLLHTCTHARTHAQAGLRTRRLGVVAVHCLSSGMSCAS